MAKYLQGSFNPKNINKYAGNPTNICYRSSWELKYMQWCDANPNIIKWNSEEVVIPYRCDTDSKIHRYFCDFQMQVKTASGEIKTYLVEIKPAAQCEPPKFPGRQTKRYINESLTYVKNQSKWKQAEQYARDRGWEFVVLTEKHLF